MNFNMEELKMKKKAITKEARKLFTDFCQEFSFVTITVETVQAFLNDCNPTSAAPKTALLFDYVLSQDLAEEVQL